MRTMTMILLLAVCFFGGVTYGTFEKNNIQQDEQVEEQSVVIAEPIVENIENDLQTIEINETEEKDPVVNKSAALLEKIVTSLYEIVIQFMYKIANLFFGS